MIVRQRFEVAARATFPFHSYCRRLLFLRAFQHQKLFLQRQCPTRPQLISIDFQERLPICSQLWILMLFAMNWIVLTSFVKSSVLPSWHKLTQQTQHNSTTDTTNQTSQGKAFGKGEAKGEPEATGGAIQLHWDSLKNTETTQADGKRAMPHQIVPQTSNKHIKKHNKHQNITSNFSKLCGRREHREVQWRRQKPRWKLPTSSWRWWCATSKHPGKRAMHFRIIFGSSWALGHFSRLEISSNRM